MKKYPDGDSPEPGRRSDARGSGELGAAVPLSPSTTDFTSCARAQRGDQQRVAGVHDHHVVEPEDGDRAAAAGHDQAGAVDGDDLAGVAQDRRRPRRRAGSRPSRAAKSPTSSQPNAPGTDGHLAGGGGGLGDGVVDGDLGQAGPALLERVGVGGDRAQARGRSGWFSASRSRRTLARATNMPAFQR